MTGKTNPNLYIHSRRDENGKAMSPYQQAYDAAYEGAPGLDSDRQHVANEAAMEAARNAMKKNGILEDYWTFELCCDKK